MARNTHTVYKSSTDLRGKFVELRDGTIVYITCDGERFPLTEYYVLYYFRRTAPDQHVRQKTLRGNKQRNNDIMKVIPFTDLRIDLRGREVRLRSGEEFVIPKDADRARSFTEYISYYWNAYAVFQGGEPSDRDIVKVLK